MLSPRASRPCCAPRTVSCPWRAGASGTASRPCRAPSATSCSPHSAPVEGVLDGNPVDGALVDGALVDGVLDGARVDGARVDNALDDGVLDGALVDDARVDGASVDGDSSHLGDGLWPSLREWDGEGWWLVRMARK